MAGTAEGADLACDGVGSKDMALSVILAARDMAAFLPETLASLTAQTEARFELIAVDDGSGDATGAMLADYAAAQGSDRPVRVIRTEGIGLAAARNRAVEASGGGLLVILDGDDVLAPDLLSRARRLLSERDDVDLVFTLCDHVDSDGRRLGVRSPLPSRPLTPESLLIRPPIHTDSGVVVRRGALNAAGGFEPALTGCIGLDAWFRVLSLRPGNTACIAEPLVLYRRRPGQITGSAARMERNLMAFLALRGNDTTPRLVRRVLAAHRLYWASIAYAEGDEAQARAYTAAAWRTDLAGLVLTPYAYARAVISLASLLPGPLHRSLRGAALAVRARRR